MSDDHPKLSAQADADLQREIRAERKFTLAEAIGRLGGPGIMKGVSPVTRKQQAEAEIEEYLIHHLPDSGGALSGVLLRQVKESEMLLRGFDQPLVALAGYVRHLLASEYCLKELVREADCEWGRMLGEQPCFEIDGCPPAAGDPYTIESVHAVLIQLAGELPASEA